jgi:hypothetical protein
MNPLKNKFWLPLFFFLASFTSLTGQDSTVHTLILGISYYLPADNIPYLKVKATEKVERKFIPQTDIIASVYINEETEANLLKKTRTDEKGESIVYLPAALKSLWDSSASMKFIVSSEATKIFEPASSEIEITKAKIEMDTSTVDEVKNITAKVLELKDGDWQPVNEAELKIAVKRSLGILPAGEEELYTTDSTGIVVAEFNKDSLPGDGKGQLTLVAYTEDNELYGNIFAEMIVPWGVAPQPDTTFFDKRSLWATRFRTPYWLLTLAYAVIGIVWGTLIYLFFLLLKIRKLGKVSV